MQETAQAWRKKMRLQLLVDMARKELESGKEFEEFSDKLEKTMQNKWRLVHTTRKQYLDMVRKILDDEFVLQLKN